MLRKILPLCLLLTMSVVSAAQERFTLEALFTHPRITGYPPSGILWSPDASKLAILWNANGNRFQDLYLINTRGKLVRLTDLQNLPREQAAQDDRTVDQKREESDLDQGLTELCWSRDGHYLYFIYRGDVFRVQDEGGAPLRLFQTKIPEGRLALNRDGRWLAYTSGEELFALNLKTGSQVQLTRDGSENIHNGGSAYDTYLEGAFWAPDSRKLAFVQYDVTGFDRLLIPDYTTKKVRVTEQQREVAGGRLPGIKLGIINPDSAHLQPLWIKLPADQQFYLRSLDWSPDSRKLLLEVMPRPMQERFLLLADVSSGQVDTLWHEADNCWLADHGAQARFGPEGKSIIFASELSGWCHLYSYPLGAKKADPKPLTSGNWEVEGDWTLSFDRRVLLYSSSEDNSAERHLYRIDLPPGNRRRITSETGWLSSFAPAEDGSKVAVIYSDLNQPHDLYWCETNGSKRLQRLTTSQPKAFARYNWFAPQYVTIPTSDGQCLPAKLWLPPNRKGPAPLVVYIHGAGYAQNVDKAVWGFDDRFHRLLAQEGFAVVDIDYRGSSGYGRAWRTAIYRHLGGRDLDDAVDAVKYCVQQGWADSLHIGIWGWSYGGFLTNMAMFKRPEIFKVGCSVAAVNDWKNYNLWYTTQRFTFPETDSLAYAQSSPINFAGGLRGKLLLVHGLQDDNVHAQDALQLVDELISLNKDFDLMIYPREDHGFQRDCSNVHVQRAILEYFQIYLKY